MEASAAPRRLSPGMELDGDGHDSCASGRRGHLVLSSSPSSPLPPPVRRRSPVLERADRVEGSRRRRCGESGQDRSNRGGRQTSSAGDGDLEHGPQRPMQKSSISSGTTREKGDEKHKRVREEEQRGRPGRIQLIAIVWCCTTPRYTVNLADVVVERLIVRA
ncbi:hypothetical protein ACQ4PT_027794 [Festuca glaucescens]